MNRIAVDCEFNGFGGQLISMALVSEHGAEWYQVLQLPAVVDDWVAEHVVPIRFKEPVSREHFRLSLKTFLEAQPNAIILADWYTDLMHFFQCFEGESHEHSMHIPISAELLPNMEFKASEVPHNALFDARAIMATVLAK